MDQDTSNVSPLALIGLLTAAYLIWSLPRRLAVCPILAMVCLMPLGQELVLFGLHFYLFRVLLLVGVLRVVIKQEVRQLVMTRTDKFFLAWISVSIVFGTLAKPSMELFINRLGDAYNAAGCYFLMRCLLVDFEDLVTSVRTLAWLSLPVAALMLVEKTTGHNLFSVFGGVPEITSIREGHLRCQGAFRHPILAGTFGATQTPLFIALWFYRPQYRLVALLATISSLIIVGAASSSGALMAVMASIGGMALWKWKTHMRLVRRGAVVTLLILAVVMKAPVWYLFDRLSSITGGTGWFRSFLIDQTIAHFHEWWLFGTTYTAHWAPAGEVPAGDPNNMDITNHYIVQGVSGGLLKLILFLAIIVVSFKTVGRWFKAQEADSSAGILVWAAGVSLFAHCLSFVSTTYFDQIVVVWYWLLAMIASIPAWGSEVVVTNPVEQAAGSVVEENVPVGENQFTARAFFDGVYDFRRAMQEHLTNFISFSSCIWKIPLGIVNAPASVVKTYKLFFYRAQWFLKVQTLAVAGFLFFFLVSANAATWYVDSTAVGANNGTSWANAWTALSSVTGVAGGDTVYISGGPSGSSQTYSIASGWAPKGGTSASSRITYQIGQDASHNGTAIFSGTGSFLSAPSNASIIGDAGDGKQHFATSGCTGIAGGSFSNLRIGYINFGVMQGNINGACLYAGSVNGFEFDHNYVYQNYTSADAILHVDGFTGNNYDQNQIHDNTLYTIGTGNGGMGSDGMVFSGTGFTISNNVEISIPTNRWNTAEGQHADGWQTSGGSYVKICNNLIWGFTDIGLYGGCWGSANNGLTYFSHVRIFNNVIDGGVGQQDVGCIEVEADNQTGSTFSDIGIYNNFCRVPTSTQGWGLFIGSSSTTGGTWSNVWATNNFIVAPTSGQRAYIINATVGESLNPWFTDAQAAPMMANFVAGKYTSDYHLAAGATSLIGKGANLYSYVTIDKDGNARPAAGAWDIGPYEYGSSGGSTNPLIVVSPTSLDFGTVLAGSSTNLTLTVQNIGGGTLAGVASVSTPFAIVSGGTYSLGSNQTQTVTVKFNPSAAGVYGQTINFTGGNGASASLTGLAYAMEPGLTFGAASGTILAPFTATATGLVPSGAYISQAGNTGLSGSGEAIYGFSLASAGSYVVSALVNAPNSAANSFYVNIDGQPTDPTMIWDPPVTAGFTPVVVSWRGTGTDTNNQFAPQVFSLSAGNHQLIIRGREAGAQLGDISIVPYAVPSAPTGLRVVGP